MDAASGVAGGVAVRRCPGCGRRMEAPPPRRCPLCDYEFEEEEESGADVTPYAQSLATRERPRRRMSAWVWSARAERLKHLALMQRSAASARFSYRRILLLAGGLALLQASVFGWHNVLDVAPGGVELARPGGQGWFQVGTGLWWNPAQAILIAVSAFVGALLCILLMMALLRAGAARAHGPAYGQARRMSAAIDYATAWAAPVLIALAVLPLRILGRLGEAAHWGMYPPVHGIDVLSGIAACGGAILMWFWLIRLGATAPDRVRGKVIAFFVLVPPLLAVGAAALWWFGLTRVYGPLFAWLKLSF